MSNSQISTKLRLESSPAFIFAANTPASISNLIRSLLGTETNPELESAASTATVNDEALLLPPPDTLQAQVCVWYYERKFILTDRL